MDKEQLGNLLKLLRSRKGLSQKELAELLYTSAPMVCKWEKGIFTPTSDMMLRIAQFYEIPVEDLYFPERTLERLGNPAPDDVEKTEEVSSGEKQNWIARISHRPVTVVIAAAALVFIVAAAVYDTLAGANKLHITDSVGDYAENSELDEPVIMAMAEFGDYALLLRLYDGQYESVYSLGPDFGANWTGEYELVLMDLYSSTVISQYPLTEWDEALRFEESFALQLTDLNSDGCPEVLIGQYAGSNYNLYKMYYIDEDMQIGWYSEIGDLLISSQEMSPALEVVEEKITYSFYDNASGETVTREIDLSALNLY